MGLPCREHLHGLQSIEKNQLGKMSERGAAAAPTWGSVWPVATSALALLFTLMRP